MVISFVSYTCPFFLGWGGEGGTGLRLELFVMLDLNGIFFATIFA